jgi:hypothetical protein
VAVIARLGERAAPVVTRCGEESGRPIMRSGLPDPRLTIAALVTLGGVRVRRDLSELGLVARVSRWLARSLRRYAARNCSIENTVRRDSM